MKIDSFKKIPLLILFFILLLIFIFNIPVSALSNKAQVAFKTADIIIVNGNQYVFAGWYTGSEVKKDTNDKVRRAYKKDDSCSDFIAVNKNNAEVRLIKASESNTSTNKSCSFSSWESSEKLNNITDESNRFIIYYWQDKDTIVRLANGFNGTEIGSVSYTRDGNSSKFIENTGGNCKDEININSPTDASYIARSSTNEKQLISWNSDGAEVKEQANNQVAGCYETKSVGIKIGYSENSDKKPGEATPVPGSGDTETGSGDDAAQEANCSQALSPFGWVLCPATNFADDLYSFFKQLVNNLLFFESDKYQDNGLYDSWKVMVTLANTVLVLVAIVMIAAQIFNFEFISAYTVKKALPRIVIAAILIQLSWFMVTTGIQIVNAIGSGMYWLLVAPFTQNIDAGDSGGVLEIGPILAQNYSGTDNGNAVGNFIGWNIAGAALGAAALGAAFSGLWISIVIAAIGVIISLLVAIVTLVIREVLLIVLIAIAPIAIAFWILPGTNNLWNMWWKTFSRLLMMYPLIMLLFAGGTIAAILLASAGGGINILFAIIAFFAPMFMIGATYKFAGGAFASIANMTGKIGANIKGKASQSNLGGLKKVAENQKAARDYNRQERAIRNIERTGGRGLRGSVARIQAGTAGARGSYAEILRAQEEKKSMENANFAYSQATKGMQFPNQVDDSLALASARAGEAVTLSNGRSIVATESTQRVAAKFLADTGRSDQIRELESSLVASGRQELWNTISSENAGSITKINPDQMGKAFDTLSATEMSEMKPGSIRNMRAMMADASVPQARKDAIMRQVQELYNNETLRSKVGDEGLSHIEEMLTSPNLTRASTSIQDAGGISYSEVIDRFGQSEHIILNGQRVANQRYTGGNGWSN